MKLLQNETLLVNSNEDKVLLTNLRVHMNDKDWGRSYSITLFLEDISSIEVIYRSNLILILIAIMSLLLWLITNYNTGSLPSENVVSMGLIMVAVICFVLYWFTRKHTISITPDGGKQLNFVVSHMKDEQIYDFVYKLQEAKAFRIKELNKIG